MIKRYFTILSAIALLVFAVPAVPVFAAENAEPVTSPVDGAEKVVHTVTFVVSMGDQSLSFSAAVEDGGSVSVPSDIPGEIMDDEGNIYELSAWKDASGNAVDLSNVTSDMTVYASYVNKGAGSNDDDPAEKVNKKKNSNSGSDEDKEESSTSGSPAAAPTAPAAPAAVETVVAPAVAPNTAAENTNQAARPAAVDSAEPAGNSVAAPDDVVVGIDPGAEVGGPVSRDAIAEPEVGAIAGPVAPETVEIEDGPVALAGTMGGTAFPWWIIAVATALAAVFGGFRYTQFKKNEQ